MDAGAPGAHPLDGIRYLVHRLCHEGLTIFSLHCVNLFREAIVLHCFEIASKFKQFVYDCDGNRTRFRLCGAQLNDKFRSVLFSMQHKSIGISIHYT